MSNRIRNLGGLLDAVLFHQEDSSLTESIERIAEARDTEVVRLAVADYIKLTLQVVQRGARVISFSNLYGAKRDYKLFKRVKLGVHTHQNLTKFYFIALFVACRICHVIVPRVGLKSIASRFGRKAARHD